jgi:very-short-patch-repair endonuclease
MFSMPTLEKRHRPLALRMRRAPVSNEAALWAMLRNRRVAGLKFRRQVPIGRYIVDFVCLRHRLIIEADGPFHDLEYDQRRDAWLAGQSFRILRFPNALVGSEPETVRRRIREAVAPRG